MTAPLITVMIPCYNQASFITEAVKSTLGQNYQNIEIIILDDASTDNTYEISKTLAYDDRVRVVRHTQNLGRVANYRHGLYHEAKGKWVINLDGDDVFTDSGYLSAAQALTDTNPDIVMVFGKVEMGAVRGKPGNRILNSKPQMPPVMDGMDFIRRFPPLESLGPLHASCLYRRDTAIAESFYSHNILSADFESFYRLMAGRRVAFLDRIAAFWRQHGANASSSPNLETQVENLKVLTEPARYFVAGGFMTAAEADGWVRRGQGNLLLSALLHAVTARSDQSIALSFVKHLLMSNPRVILQLPMAAFRRSRF